MVMQGKGVGLITEWGNGGKGRTENKWDVSGAG
jgi:hypothetical protein